MEMKRRRFVVRSMTALAVGPSVLACRDVGESTSEGAGSSGSVEGTTAATSTGSAVTSSSSTTDAGDSSSSTGEASTGEPRSTTGSSSEGSSGSSETSTGSAACEPTPSDIEGPFYRPNIPVGGDLDVHGDVGQALRIEGRVLDEACTPIGGAVVEIWHATPVAPGGMPGDQEATYDDTAAYRYYGQVATDDAGAFAFSTLRPGWYLNGEAYRPAHVHVKVWVEDTLRLTTQLYFEGDPFNEQDPWFNPLMALELDGRGVAGIDIVV